VAERGTVRLVDGPHFRLDRLDGPPAADTAERYSHGPLLVIPLDAPAQVGEATIPPGGCGIAEAIGAVRIRDGGRVLIAQAV
jgi:mannose-6-phosphate isomerase